MKMYRLPLLLIALFPVATLAEETAPPDPVMSEPDQGSLIPPRRREAELSAGYDLLDNDYQDQQSLRLDLVSARPGHNTYYGALVRQQRFGLADHGIELGVSYPLTERWSAFTEAGFAFDPEFLPNGYAEAGAERRFGLGLGLRAGYRRSVYDDTWVDRLAITGDRYWGPWRGAYTLNLTWLETADLALGHSLSLTRFYGERNYWGVRAAFAEEKELDAERVVLATNTSAFGLFGRHWFRPRWALGWDLDASRQGELYNRLGIRLGIRHAF